MEISFSGRMDFYFAEIEQIQLPSKRALGAASAFRNCLNNSVLVGAPVHDHARLGKWRASNQCAACFQSKNSFLSVIDNLYLFQSCEKTKAPMKEELQAIDIDLLKARLSELRRYL